MAEKLIEIWCAFCHQFHDEVTEKSAPKTFECKHCHVGQAVVPQQRVAYAYKRNYPEGHFTN